MEPLPRGFAPRYPAVSSLGKGADTKAHGFCRASPPRPPDLLTAGAGGRAPYCSRQGEQSDTQSGANFRLRTEVAGAGDRSSIRRSTRVSSRARLLFGSRPWPPGEPAGWRSAWPARSRDRTPPCWASSRSLADLCRGRRGCGRGPPPSRRRRGAGTDSVGRELLFLACTVLAAPMPPRRCRSGCSLMLQVLRASLLGQAEGLQLALSASGIPSYVSGRTLGGVLPEAFTVWIVNDEDAPRAREIIAGLERSPQSPVQLAPTSEGATNEEPCVGRGPSKSAQWRPAIRTLTPTAVAEADAYYDVARAAFSPWRCCGPWSA